MRVELFVFASTNIHLPFLNLDHNLNQRSTFDSIGMIKIKIKKKMASNENSSPRISQHLRVKDAGSCEPRSTLWRAELHVDPADLFRAGREAGLNATWTTSGCWIHFANQPVA